MCHHHPSLNSLTCTSRAMRLSALKDCINAFTTRYSQQDEIQPHPLDGSQKRGGLQFKSIDGANVVLALHDSLTITDKTQDLNFSAMDFILKYWHDNYSETKPSWISDAFIMPSDLYTNARAAAASEDLEKLITPSMCTGIATKMFTIVPVLLSGHWAVVVVFQAYIFFSGEQKKEPDPRLGLRILLMNAFPVENASEVASTVRSILIAAHMRSNGTILHGSLMFPESAIPFFHRELPTSCSTVDSGLLAVHHVQIFLGVPGFVIASISSENDLLKFVRWDPLSPRALRRSWSQTVEPMRMDPTD